MSSHAQTGLDACATATSGAAAYAYYSYAVGAETD
jgi:hypothetical protein